MTSLAKKSVAACRCGVSLQYKDTIQEPDGNFFLLYKRYLKPVSPCRSASRTSKVSLLATLSSFDTSGPASSQGLPIARAHLHCPRATSRSSMARRATLSESRRYGSQIIVVIHILPSPIRPAVPTSPRHPLPNCSISQTRVLRPRSASLVRMCTTRPTARRASSTTRTS